MQTIYGPIPSRRLGQSLGVDPVPLKTCNWNCIYCQLGRTSRLTNIRREYVPRMVILAELESVLARHAADTIDYISVVGSGEPTLYSGLGWLIRRVKEMTALPVAVITNGSLLYLSEVRSDLLPADVVMPTLVAGTADLYMRICRPHPDITFARMVDGLSTFRAEYTGRLWVEIMLISGVNDSPAALQALATLLRRVEPDEVHITLPTRPPSETWVQPPDEEGILRAAAILGDVAHVVQADRGSFDLRGAAAEADEAGVVDAVVAIITRHPMSQTQLENALTRWSADQIDGALAALQSSGRAQTVERLGERFWASVDSRFPNGSCCNFSAVESTCNDV